MWTLWPLPSAGLYLHMLIITPLIPYGMCVPPPLRRWICTGTTTPTQTATVGPVKTVSPPKLSLVFTPASHLLHPLSVHGHFSFLSPLFFFFVSSCLYCSSSNHTNTHTYTHITPALRSWANSCRSEMTLPCFAERKWVFTGSTSSRMSFVCDYKATRCITTPLSASLTFGPIHDCYFCTMLFISGAVQSTKLDHVYVTFWQRTYPLLHFWTFIRIHLLFFQVNHRVF